MLLYVAASERTISRFFTAFKHRQNIVGLSTIGQWRTQGFIWGV